MEGSACQEVVEEGGTMSHSPGGQVVSIEDLQQIVDRLVKKALGAAIPQQQASGSVTSAVSGKHSHFEYLLSRILSGACTRDDGPPRGPIHILHAWLGKPRVSIKHRATVGAW